MVNLFDQVTRLVKQDDIQPPHVASNFHAEATELRLSAEQYDAFIAALDGPAKPKPRLEELMKTPILIDRESEPMSGVIEVVDDSGARIDDDADLRSSIERGLADAEAGQVVAVEDLMKEFGIEDLD